MTRTNLQDFADDLLANGVSSPLRAIYGRALTRPHGHLMPGNDREAAGMLDAYLARTDLVPVV